jgi:oligopeptide transport system permease protein
VNARARRAAPLALASLAVVALAGPPLATRVSGFASDEQHTAFPFAPPGFADVPQGRQSPDGDAAAFGLLALGRTRLACADRDGALRCQGTDEAAVAARRLTLVLADAWQAGGADGTIPESAVRLAVAFPAWSSAVAVACRDGRCPLADTLRAARFLYLTPETLAAMDRDGDGAVDAAEFLGAPELRTHWLGTDGLGRDLAVRLLDGLRTSLLIGGAAALAAAALGVAWGAVAGLAGGFAGAAMMRVVDVLYGLPFLFVVILLIAVAGPSLWNLFVAIAAVQWLGMARTVRGLVASLAASPFVEEARVLGCGPVRLLRVHLLPNARGPILAWTALLVPASIREEAFLSFLGLGVQAPAASLGTLIADGAPRIAEHPWLIAAPAATLFLVVLLVNALCEERAPRAGQ